MCTYMYVHHSQHVDCVPVDILLAFNYVEVYGRHNPCTYTHVCTLYVHVCVSRMMLHLGLKQRSTYTTGVHIHVQIA